MDVALAARWLADGAVAAAASAFSRTLVRLEAQQHADGGAITSIFSAQRELRVRCLLCRADAAVLQARTHAAAAAANALPDVFSAISLCGNAPFYASLRLVCMPDVRSC